MWAVAGRRRRVPHNQLAVPGFNRSVVTFGRHADMFGGRRSRLPSSTVTPDAPSPQRPRWQSYRAPSYFQFRSLNFVFRREWYLYLYRLQPQVLHHTEGKVVRPYGYILGLGGRQWRTLLGFSVLATDVQCILNYFLYIFDDLFSMFFCFLHGISHHPYWIDTLCFEFSRISEFALLCATRGVIIIIKKVCFGAYFWYSIEIFILFLCFFLFLWQFLYF